MERVQVLGLPGSGKTTFAKALSEKTGLTYIDLDGLFMKPGWQMSEANEFQEKVSAVLKEVSGGWIADAFYKKRLDGLLYDQVDTVFIFDQRWPVNELRVIKRGVRRILSSEEVFEGCVERPKNLYYLLKAVGRQREKYAGFHEDEAMFRDLGVEVIRFKNNRESDAFLKAFDSLYS